MKTSNLIKLARLSDELRMGGKRGSTEPYNWAFKPVNEIYGLIDMIETAGGLKDKTVVEIGSFLGVSTEAFILHEPKQLYAVDVWGTSDDYTEIGPQGGMMDNMSWEDVEESCRERMSKYSNVEVIKDFSTKVAERFKNESLDFVYIDGDHSAKGVSDDICAWYPKIKHGGHIAGHDYYDKIEDIVGVEEMVLALLEPLKIGWSSSHLIPSPNPDDHVMGFEDTSWLFRKV